MGIIFLLFFVGLPIVAIIMAKRRRQEEAISPTRRRIRGLASLGLAIFITAGVLIGLGSTYAAWGMQGFSDKYGIFQLFWSGVWLFFAGALYYFYWMDRRR